MRVSKVERAQEKLDQGVFPPWLNCHLPHPVFVPISLSNDQRNLATSSINKETSNFICGSLDISIS